MYLYNDNFIANCNILVRDQQKKFNMCIRTTVTVEDLHRNVFK